MSRRASALLAALLLGLTAAGPALAVTKIEGDYQLMMELRKDLRAFPWDFDSNDYPTYTPMDFRVFSQPRQGIEAFVKFEAEWRRGDNQADRPDFQYDEAHMRFRREWGNNHGVDIYLFSRQDRFWVDNYLIRFISGRSDRQGIRLDTWPFLGMNATFIVADQSNQLDPQNAISGYSSLTGYPAALAPLDSLLRQREKRTDDMFIARLRREFLEKKQLRLGLTYSRYEGWAGRDSVSGPSQWNSMIAADSRYLLGGTAISVEYAQSMPNLGDYANPEISIFKRPTGIRLPDRSVSRVEIRSIRLGTERLGYLNIIPSWWVYGPGWSNYLGDPWSDETGFSIDSYYLLPERAITYSNLFKARGNKVFSESWTRETYNELYVEFVNGFTGKTAYDRTESYNTVGNRRTRDTYQSWFNELQVESRLAYLRVQSKLINIGRTDHKQLFVIEERINLTDNVKVYNRFAFGNDPSILRKGIFTQLQYRPTGNMEMFLQYGPDDIGGGSIPVDDPNLSGSGDQYDVIKFILKGSF